MLYLGYFLVLLVAFVMMEGIAWALHKYVMHGFLWILHEDHHRPHKKRLEKNDFFAIIFAVPSWLFMMFGIMDGNDYKLYIGIGITLYGICYLLVHDGLIHKRYKLFSKVKNPWLIALQKGHQAHHAHKPREKSLCFGMLFVPLKFYRAALREQKLSSLK